MKTQETTKGFAVLSIAALLVKILSLLYVPLLYKIIGEEGYGVYYASYSVFVFIYIVTTTGIPTAISKQVTELISVNNYKDAVKTFKIARVIMIIAGSLMTLLMIIFSKNLAAYVEYDKANYSIIALAPTILFSAVRSAYMGYYQGQDNMTPRAVSQVIEQIINVIFSLLFAYLWVSYG
ncbi:MAG: oligosaccharide flippase family protein, partial [Bacillota bacterium]|nr:oligosaccharide flippase family protein [Bacillota bacterium]